MTTIPQLRGAAKNILTILIMGPIGGVALASIGGELHTWADIPKALDHGAFMSVGITCGWIFLRSPWAAQYQSLTKESTQTKELDTGQKVTTKTSETVTVEKSPPEKGES